MLRHLRRLEAIGRRTRKYYTVKSEVASSLKENPLPKQLEIQIKAAGPITVAEYMKQVLIHPMGGYYIHKDAFGPTGDFVTSPEISQMFGEMIAIWFLNEWQKIGSPKPLNIVELGPGRGSLMQDLLRVFGHFDALKEASIHMVEVSDLMADMQARRLCINVRRINEKDANFYKEGYNSNGIPIRWYRNFSQLPPGFSFLIAHEFFDALPIHKFVKTPEGYRELLIDIDETTPGKFRYVRAREQTPVGKMFIRGDETRSDIEISPDSLVLAKDISQHLEEHGGFALIADYGHSGDGKVEADTFRAYKQHKQHDPLVDPGSADLTADVDFGVLQKAIHQQGGTITFGPVTQREFLLSLGMQQRLEKLKQIEGVTDETRKVLDSSFAMLTDEAQMGKRFKFLAVMPAVLQEFLKKFPPVGFTNT
ncbi:LOW QUALITY PROTEIN: protein arginine methyltransferase NDUFAF7 homolog, mitochondrial [Atheta coriaria]|uniref:LOW QUALITY PROTEIN: protein arginine methyltransferase NDUFAF7 homolog, mitochondrial n=1 Tax=Dalotia coriaria TaxID=877792 RepID=UPI0031F3D866